MIKSYLLLVAFVGSLFLAACSEEPYRIEDSVCGKFLESHSDIVKDYQYISCFDSTHAVYQLKRKNYEAFLVDVRENQIGKQQLIEYQKFSENIVFRDVDTLKTNEISSLFSKRFSIARKNDSTFYVAESNNGQPNRIMLFSREGKKVKDLFSYLPITSCFENPLIYNMRPQGTDTTFSMKFSYVREENKVEYDGYVSLDLKNDSLSYGSQDSLTIFHVTHYKTNGDSIFTAPEFKEVDLEKTKRRKCIGHFF